MPRSWRDDLALVIWGALTFGALLASFSGFRPVRDALVLDGSPDDIPMIWAGTFVAVSIASPLWSKLLARRAKRKVVPIAFHVFAVMAAGFALAVELAPRSVWVGRGFYIWSSMFNLFVVSVFWSLLADLVGPVTAKRLYGPIAAGGTIGAFLAPLLTKLLVEHVAISGIIALSIAFLELAALGVWGIRRNAEGHAPAPDEPAHSDLTTGIQRVAQSRYLLAICGYVLCTATAATFFYLEQASIVDAAFPGRSDAARIARTEFFATLDYWTQGTTFVVQTLLASALLRWVGPGVVLCILPLAQLAGISTLVATGSSLAVLSVIMVTTRAATHGLARPARELLFTAVDRDDKYHAKNVIDTIVYRLGDLGSSFLHKGLVSMAAGASALVIASIPLAAIWVTLAISLGIGFRRRTEHR